MMKSTCASLVALAVLCFAVDAHAGCGNCGPKDTKETSAAKASEGCCGKCGTKETSAAKATEECCGKCGTKETSAAKASEGCCGKCGTKETSAKATEGGCGESCSSEKCAAGGCSSEKCAGGECDASKGCPITAAMARLPKMTYTVAGKETCCPKEAAKLAKEVDSHFHFCVAGKDYETEAEAQSALIEETERFVAAFAEPKKCPKSGQLTLAGEGQSCEKTAARLATAMKKAMEEVKLTYMVGEKECGCPVEAGKLAKETGKEKLLCVGEEKTCCEKTARLNLARAKYKAAVGALVKAQSESSAEATTGS